MHTAALNYVRDQIGGRHFGTVIEIGGRDINGGVTDLFTCDRYVSLDLEPGPGVDVVADAKTWRPTLPADLVICCEVLEHEPAQRDLVLAAVDYLKPGGMLLVTAGGPGRAPHSGHDGGPPHPGEPYGNLDPDHLRAWLDLVGCTGVDVVYNARPCDVYGVAYRSGLAVEHPAPAGGSAWFEGEEFSADRPGTYIDVQTGQVTTPGPGEAVKYGGGGQ